jgi:hypothetical protein
VITAVPPDTPVTIPVPGPTVATAVLPLLHAPPVVASFKIVVPPGHRVKVPMIGVRTMTDMDVVAEQPAMVVYTIVALPTFSPLTTPLELPMPTIEGPVLTHVPPVTASLKVAVPPRHTVEGPIIGVNGSIVIVTTE